MTPEEAKTRADQVAAELVRQMRAATCTAVSADGCVPGVHMSGHAAEAAGCAVPLVVVTIFRVGTAEELHALHVAVAMTRLRYDAATVSVVFA